jgi:hypothetical protein
MVKEVKVKDIKKGDKIFQQENGGWKYMAYSDCYYDNSAGVWRINIGDGYTYGFTSNGDGKVTILQGN